MKYVWKIKLQTFIFVTILQQWKCLDGYIKSIKRFKVLINTNTLKP